MSLDTKKKKRERGFGSHSMAVIEPPCEALEPLRAGPGPYRPNVAGIVLRAVPGGHEILLGERHDRRDAWQWPQGGMDPGETPEAALLRELREEIGVTHPQIVYRFPFLLRYRFPESLANRFKRWIGQEQAYFVVTLSADDPPGLDRATEEEFRQLRWFPLQQALKAAVWFKEPIYQAALTHIHEVLPTLKL